jgi:DNA-binding MarR family transcriptional regulator
MLERTPPPIRNPGLLFWKTGNAWRRWIGRVLRPQKLTATEFLVLHAFAEMCAGREEPSQQDVADWLDLDKMTVSQVARALERRNLLDRGDVSYPDARSWRILVTGEGRKLHRAALAQVERATAVFFSHPDLRDAVAGAAAAIRKDPRRPKRRKKGGGG